MRERTGSTAENVDWRHVLYELVGRYGAYSRGLEREMLGEQQHTHEKVRFWQEELARSFDAFSPLIETCADAEPQQYISFAHAQLRSAMEALQTDQEPLDAIYSAFRYVSRIAPILEELQEHLVKSGWRPTSGELPPFVFPDRKTLWRSLCHSLDTLEALPSSMDDREVVSRCVRTHLQLQRLGIVHPAPPSLHQELASRLAAVSDRIRLGAERDVVERLEQCVSAHCSKLSAVAVTAEQES